MENTLNNPTANIVKTTTRPKPGERKIEILQTLASMLESPTGELVTTKLLAARIGVSEAALYRHFASKAQMFEGLIDFIEQTVRGLTAQIAKQHADNGLAQVQALMQILLEFAMRNKGMTRVLVGDALVHENDRLQVRINALLDGTELAMKQALRVAAMNGQIDTSVDIGARANMMMAYVMGRWLRYSKSGFKTSPTDGWQVHLAVFLK